jgi:hypothetical protein
MYNNGSGSGQVCSPLIRNCAFQGNTAGSNGGAMYNNGSSSGSSSPNLTNCILFGNGGNNTIRSSNTTLTATYSLFEPASVTVTGMSISGPGNLTVTTSFFASTTSTQLAATGPAINAGDPATTSALVGLTDLARNVRIVNGRIDMGAYEFQMLEVFSLKDGLWNDATV